MKTIVLANLNYCPLIWMSSSKPGDNEINRTHERALRVLYENDNLSFDTCLIKEENYFHSYKFL